MPTVVPAAVVNVTFPAPLTIVSLKVITMLSVTAATVEDAGVTVLTVGAVVSTDAVTVLVATPPESPYVDASPLKYRYSTSDEIISVPSVPVTW